MLCQSTSRRLSPSRASRYAFTLVELLVVIAVIGVLIALLLPAVQAAREAARRMSCSNNLKQLGIAVHNYHDTLGCLPPGQISGTAADSCTNFGWAALILPFIEQSNLGAQLNFKTTIIDGADADGVGVSGNARIGATLVPSFLCPSDQDRGLIRCDDFLTSGSAGWGSPYERAPAHYSGICSERITVQGAADPMNGRLGVIVGANPIYGSGSAPDRFSPPPRLGLESILDGTSNTAMIAETASYESTDPKQYGNGQWISGTNIFRKNIERINFVPQCEHFSGKSGAIDQTWTCTECSRYQHDFRSWHPTGASALYADGSAHFLSDTTAIETLGRLCNRQDGETP